MLCQKGLISLPNDTYLDLTKFKAFADDKLNVVKIMIYQQDRVVNIVGKGENAGYQQFLFFSQCLIKASFSGSLKVGIAWLMHLQKAWTHVTLHSP